VGELYEDLTIALDDAESTVRHAAVRAVLELHKPEFFGGVVACLACSPGMPPQLLVAWSDCPTVRAIAQALDVPIGDQQ
jgi:hypothetical protein